MRSTRSGHSRRVGAAVLTAVAVAGACGGCGSVKAEGDRQYCAIMSDTIGLYVGNPVTQMGFQIGEVTSINSTSGAVRVEFTTAKDRPLPAEVRAVIRSTSILADRALELVGNYETGPKLNEGQRIPLQRSATPKGLSEIIGSMTTFVNSISPDDSSNIRGSVEGINRLIRHNGPAMNQLVTTTSALLDSPDQAINDLGSIVTNLADLTTAMEEIRGPLKQILLDMQDTTGDVAKAVDGADRMINNISPLITLVSDLETHLGDETQLTLDSMSFAMRKMTPHANALANLMHPVPWWINWIANHVNNRQFNIAIRPPMYRIRTHDGLIQCGIMNARLPGSCADINGQPHAVDVALLQYVLTEASR